MPQNSAWFAVLCSVVFGKSCASAEFTVIGPDRPVRASVSGEAILSCYLSPGMSAEKMEVRWMRSQFSMVVHHYHDGKDQYGEQMLEYQNRTELLKDITTNGRVSLRIRNIQPSDDGQYMCLFQSGEFYEEAPLELQVAGVGSVPAISVEDGHGSNEIRVVCRSSGWYPEPNMLWRDLQGQLLPSASEKISPEANGLFQTEMSIVVTKESNQKMSCRVRNPYLNQERESQIFIAESFFWRVNYWMLALGVPLGLLAVLIILLAVYIWQQHRVKGKLQAEIRWRIAQLYAVDVTLDPDSAHPWLVLSVDRKHVRLGDTRQDLPNNPDRCDTGPCVLGAETFTGGRHYWEVEVGDKTEWALGVCRESVSRKGKVTLSPGNGYWAVSLRDGKYEALTFTSTPLPMSVRPSQVGIFLDYEADEVSFYNVTDRSLLFTFTDTFSGTLRPYFYTGVNAGGKNAAPLIICPVPAQSEGNL